MQLLDTAAFNISTPFGRLYSAWYDHYMAPGVFKVLEMDLHGRFMDRVGPGSRVLDVGCGGGQHAVHMASRPTCASSAWICRRSSYGGLDGWPRKPMSPTGWSSSRATRSTYPSPIRTSTICTARVPSSTGRISGGDSTNAFGCCGLAVASW